VKPERAVYCDLKIRNVMKTAEEFHGQSNRHPGRILSSSLARTNEKNI
jgi:hypothetical protein